MLKILALGNSFSCDCTTYLDRVANGLFVRNLFIGGCSLEGHIDKIQNKKAWYEYQAQGVKIGTATVSANDIIASEDWDYITVQQASNYSGVASSYSKLPDILKYVADNAPNAKIYFHMTWAYAPNSDHGAFPNYDRDQMKMYNAIVSAVYQETPKVGIKLVIPSGTAIQNARTSFLGDDLTRDGFHLSRPHGRYIAACTWLEAVLGKNPVGNTYRPEGMTEEEVKVAQKAAHKAVKKPRKVSKIK